MRQIKVLTAAALLFVGFYAQGQIPHEERTKLSHFISTHLITSLLPDSTAFYTFNIQVTIDSNNDYKPVVIANNPFVSDIVVGFKDLQNYDYNKLVGENKYVKFIIPVAITILGSKPTSSRKIDANIDEELANMFYYPTQEEEKRRLEYVGPVIITDNRTVYD